MHKFDILSKDPTDTLHFGDVKKGRYSSSGLGGSCTFALVIFLTLYMYQGV